MPANDLLYIIIWWGVLFILTIAVYPLTARLFSRFIDRGYIFAKILGILLISYIVYILGILHIAPFTFITVIGVLFVLVVVNIAIVIWKWEVGNGKWDTDLTSQVKLALVEEFLFLPVLLLWSYVRAHQPAIEGLEKLMDYGFIKSILASTYFPPQDMWLAPAPLSTEFKPEVTDMLRGFYINYYYFGHLVTAVLTKLSTLPSAVTYNLQLATIAGLTFAGSFSLGINLFASNLEHRTLNVTKKILMAGILTAFLVTFSGNLHTIYSFTPGYSTSDNQLPPPPWQLSFDTHLADYWYPNATRFIPFTIHEFPAYSFIVSDLHGHVSNIPFVLLMLAILLNLLKISSTKHQIPNKSKIQNSNIQNKKPRVYTHGFLFRSVTLLRKVYFYTLHPRIDIRGFRFSWNKPAKSWLLRFGILKFENWNLFGTWNLRFGHLLLIGFLLAVFYMTNSWDTLVYGLLSLSIILALNLFAQNNQHMRIKLSKTVTALFIIGVSFFLFSLPFNYFFHPFSSKIGVNCGYEILDSLGVVRILQEIPQQQATSIGPFLFEPGNCQKTPLWMHLILWGFFYFIIVGFFTFILWPRLKNRAQKLSFKKYLKSLALNKSSALKTESTKSLEPRTSNLELSVLTFLTLLIALSLFLLWVPEFAYIKDIYPAHFRANTMFKLGYQAFVMLSLVAGYTITKLIFNSQFSIFNRHHLARKLYLILLLPQLFLVGIYSLFGINSYYNGLRNYRGLYGLNWLRERHPDDYQAIIWLDSQAESLCSSAIKSLAFYRLQQRSGKELRTSNFEPRTVGKPDCPVIVEAVGESYTTYARVSANTGLPTVLGWPVHEWLWRGSYDEAGKRKGEVETIYTSQNTRQVKDLLTKYGVEYIFVGELEREKYPKLTEEIFRSLGTIVYQSGDTRIYKLYH